MPDMMFQALDPTGLNETAEQVRAIVQAAKSEIDAELDNLDYAQPDGIYPEMTVGAVIGADETEQWATRESTGSGQAIVRSVQGAAVSFNQLVNVGDSTRENNGVTYVTMNGVMIANGTATGGTSSASNISANVESGHKYLFRSLCEAGSSSTFQAFIQPGSQIAERTFDFGDGAFVTAIGSGAITILPLYITVGTTVNNLKCIPQIFDLTAMFGSGNEPTDLTQFKQMYPHQYYPYGTPTLKPVQIAGIASTDAQGGELDAIEWEAQTLRAAGSVCDELTSDELVTRVGVRTYQSGDESDATVRTDGTTTYYPLATPTTTPISPALPMTYRVEQGGTESIIVPDGEISAAPIITIAEPVNMSTELALIWAAIEALQGSRDSALGTVRSDSDVSRTEVKEAPTMDEKQTTERESEV